MGLRWLSKLFQRPAIFLAIFHLSRAKRIGFGLLELSQYAFMTRERCLGRPVFVSRYVAEDAQRRVADRILANISSGLGHSYVSLRIYLFFTQKPTKLPLKSSLMDYWNGCCAEHPLSRLWSPPMLCEMLITKEFSPLAHARNSTTMTRNWIDGRSLMSVSREKPWKLGEMFVEMIRL